MGVSVPSSDTESPTIVLVASIVPVGSSRTPLAPRTNGTSPRQTGRSARAERTGRVPSAPGRPRKTASIGKRMNIMWMPLLSGSHRPDPGERVRRAMRPIKFAQRPSADSMSAARRVPRVRFRATSRPEPGEGASRAGSEAGSVTSRAAVDGRRRPTRPLTPTCPGLLLGAGLWRQVDDDQDDGRPKDDDEQRREDAPDERKEHLDRGLGGLLLGALTALDAELLRLDLEDLRDRHTELLGLDDRADEVGQRGDLGTGDDVTQRVAASLADPDLGERPAELLGQRTVELLDDLAEGGVEAEAGPHGDRQQVERIRDLEQDRVLALAHPATEPELRDRVAERDTDAAHQEVEGDRQLHQADDHEQEEEDQAADDRPDSLDAEPVGDPEVAGISGESEPLLSLLLERAAGDPRNPTRHGGREGAKGSLDERLLKLELLEILGLHRSELRESGLDRIDR